MVNILFVLVQDSIGGIEKSFISLIKELSKDSRLVIDVIFFSHKNELIKELPQNVFCYPEEKRLSVIGKSQYEAFSIGFKYGVLRLFAGVMNKFISQKLGFHLIMKKCEIDKTYDVAISYQHSRTNSLYGGANEFVINEVRAEKKATFIHGDLELAQLNNDYNRKLYGEFDTIVSVSDSCKEVLDQTWPELRDKSVVVENGCDVSEIIQKAGDGFSRDINKVCFMTVARLDGVKGIRRTIDALYYVKQNGYKNFIWYVVGDGPEKASDEIYVEQLGLKENVIFLGKQNNPYFFMKNMDAILVLSYQEAAPVVFYESCCLQVPIIATRTRSAEELVERKQCGIVCDNNIESICETLLNIISHENCLKEIKENMLIKEDNDATLVAFYKILEGFIKEQTEESRNEDSRSTVL